MSGYTEATGSAKGYDAQQAHERRDTAIGRLMSMPPHDLIRMAASSIAEAEECTARDYAERQHSRASALATFAMARMMAEQQTGTPDELPQFASADEPPVTPEWHGSDGQHPPLI